MTQDERIEKLEREVAELRGMVTVLMGRACGPIMPVHYPEEPPSWDIATMLEEGRKQMLTPEGERLVREAKQQDLPRCHL